MNERAGMIADGFAAASVALAAQLIRRGELVGLPTETVYGLGADAESDAAVAKIFAAKGRPANHPLIVHVADASAVAHFADHVPEFAQRLMQAFWPGPLTLILPRRAGVAAAAAGGQSSIGLRCPSHAVTQALLKACRQTNGGQTPISLAEKELESDPNYVIWGIAAPSANQFGRVSPTTAAHVQSEFGDDLFILDGGACAVGIESTIVDCTRGRPVLLRPGAITRAQVQQVCRQPVPTPDEDDDLAATAPRASGTLESHYAPSAKVRLMNARQLQTALDLLDNTSVPIGLYSRAALDTHSVRVVHKRMPDTAHAAAQQLFAALREFDAQRVKLIWIEAPPDAAEWDGVRDRLQRAAAG